MAGVKILTGSSESCNKDSTVIGEEEHENDQIKEESLKTFITKTKIDMTRNKSFKLVQPNEVESSDFMLL